MVMNHKSFSYAFIVCSILLMFFFFGAIQSTMAQLKPRIVVLTDIAPNDIEPDDAESMVRFLTYADQFEIEGIVVCSGWNSSNRSLPLEWMDFVKKAIDAYEKDLPNLMKRSHQKGFLSFTEETKKQLLGYWPTPAYLRSVTMFGSLNQGFKELGEKNNSAGSDFLIKLAEENDDRPIWITVWGGANTLAQAVWKLKQETSEAQLKTFLHKLRVYTILDQDVPWEQRTNYSFSSHQWLRKEFEKDLFFIWDECAVDFQVSHGKDRWIDYKNNIQGHGNLGNVYPDYKWGVEGDTPSFLYVLPNGLSDPENPTQGNWGGIFRWMKGQDSLTYSYTNNKQSSAYDVCTKWVSYFYPAFFNDFAARMDWANEGKGNRNPVVVVNGDSSLNVLTIRGLQGTKVKLDASASSDPDRDKLSFKWWVLQDAGSYKDKIEIDDSNEKNVVVTIPKDSAGKNIHVVCEVTDNGTPQLTGYRRIIFQIKE